MQFDWKRKLVLTVALVGLAHTLQAKHNEVPDGFDDYLVFMATGTIPFSGHPNQYITGCGESIFCDGDYFHETIMGRNAEETAEEAGRAKAYFHDRFGVDTDALVAEGRIRFFSFFLDPRGEYRAYTVANKRVHSAGWVVRDGGFAIEVLDAEGVDLGGEFAGSGLPPIPAGGLLVFGNYNIQTNNRTGKYKGPAGKNKGEIVVSYRSDMPMIANSWGELVVNCQLSVDDFAGGVHGGKAQGMGLVTASQEGLTLSWRNVLTLGGL